MKEQFVPYELALKLKELGFDEERLGAYNQSDNNKFMIAPQLSSYEINTGKNSDKTDINVVTAPLWQQAFKFIRDKYNLTTTFHKRKKSDNTYVSIYEITKKEDFEELTHFSKVFYIDEYELQTKALKKLIEIIENKVS